jgi:predicted Zn-dependent peptidase
VHDQQQVFSHVYGNGLVLVAQPMPWLESAAFSINAPAGCRYDPIDKGGLANFVCEMVQRGSGELNSRQFIEALEFNGIDHSSSTSVYHSHFGGAMGHGQLHEGFRIYADVLRSPHLPADQVEDARLVGLQEIRGLEDDLPQKVIVELRHRHYGDPDGRDDLGSIESVSSIALSDIRRFHEDHFRPNGTIIGVAGRIDWTRLVEHVGSLFENWRPVGLVEPEQRPPQHGSHHIAFDSQQTHIALAYSTVPYADVNYYKARGAVGVLSDGLSSRLFTEVREKRGLCYAVFASYHSLLDRGAVVCYSGTTAQRAQQTLEVLVAQLRDLRLGIDGDELRRLKVQIRSSLVMQQESCRARAGAIAGDWFYLGRVRSLDEINDQINALTVESINDYLRQYPVLDLDLVTLGPQPLELPDYGISAASVG